MKLASNSLYTAFWNFFLNLIKIDLDDDDFGNYLFFLPGETRKEGHKEVVTGFLFVYFSSICACAYCL